MPTVLVVMEATGDYWRGAFYLLEDCLNVILFGEPLLDRGFELLQPVAEKTGCGEGGGVEVAEDAPGVPGAVDGDPDLLHLVAGATAPSSRWERLWC